MRCTVLVFANLRDAIGCDRLLLELPKDATVSMMLDQLATTHPAIAQLRDRRALAVAVDEKYQPPTAPLRDGCIVALIPPVSGG